MRALVLVLCLAVSPLALTLCTVTCALPATPAERVAMPSCHEDMDATAGLASNAETSCQHDRAPSSVVPAKRAVPFALMVAFAPEPVAPIPVSVSTTTADAFVASSPSPPPRLAALRI